MQTDTLSLRMAPKALHSGSFEGYWGTDPGSTESHHYLDELLNERRCYRGPCEFVTGSPYNRLLNEFTQVAASPKAYVLGASVPSLVSKHLLNLGIEWILLSQDVGAQKRADAALHFLSPLVGHNLFGPSLDVLPALLQLFEIPQRHAGLGVVLVGKRLPGALLEGNSSRITFLTFQHILVLFY